MRRWVGPLLFALCVLTACSSRPPAPVEDRSTGRARESVPVDGMYRVRRGDTLHAIAFKYGLDYRDIADWNNIRAPYVIFPDQVVRLREPARASTARRSGSSTVTTAAAPAPSARSQPLEDPPPQRSTSSPAQQAPVEQAPATPPPTARAAPTTASAPDPTGWAWPLDGRVSRTFKAGDPSRNGLDIVAGEGTPVKATAAGEVVYSGSGLIGYGELVIIKHSDRMLSAYGHNRKRLVSEGDRVRQGQQIAEVGRNDSDQSLLHFEIRRDGKPVNPANYLPKR